MKQNAIYLSRQRQSAATMNTVVAYLKASGRQCEKPTRKESKANHFDLWVNGEPVKWKMTNGAYDAIPFEINNRGHASWFSTTQATLFYYYMEASRLLYVVDVAATRSLVAKLCPRKRTDGSLGGVYYLIPLQDLKANGCIKEVVYVSN